MTLLKKNSSILNQLRGVFVLGISFLVISLFLFQSFNKKIVNGIIDAYHLDGGIISINNLQDSINNIDQTLRAAGQVYKTKGINELYLKQYNNVNSSLQQLAKDFEKFKSTSRPISEAQSSLEEIHKLARLILAQEWTINQFNSYMLNIKQHQLETSESLSKTAIEFRSLLDQTYNNIQNKKNEPFIFGLILTLILAIILGLLSSAIFRRIRLFISNHLIATNEVSKGDLQTRIPIVQEDELGSISKEFNMMVEKLQVTKNELERSNQDLEDFAYTASHDLQTPLRHISTFSEMIALGKDKATSKELIEWSDNIKVSTDSIILLIDDLLRFSKVGKEGLEKEEIQIDKLIQIVITQSQQTYPKLSIDRKPLPNVVGYKSLLHLVFQNLIDNAVKYCPKERHPKISIHSKNHSDSIEFIISDNGVGVPEDQKERIFGLFRRLHSDDEVKGSGAGLAICRKIIERHDGKLWVEDHSPQGSQFCFTIPH